MNADDTLTRVFLGSLADSTSPSARAASLSTACLAGLALDAAAVTTMSPSGHREVVSASDELVRRVEELQTLLGEGPGPTAYELGGPVLVHDLAGGEGSRWPVLAASLDTGRLRSLYAFPLQVGVIRLGVVTFLSYLPYDERPFGRDQLSTALRLADLVTGTLLASASGHALDGVDHLGRAESWPVSPVVHQATGMVLVQLGVSAAEAYARLRAYAFSRDRALADVAREVVTRRLAFQPGDP
jgi:hypothetical protein